MPTRTVSSFDLLQRHRYADALEAVRGELSSVLQRRHIDHPHVPYYLISSRIGNLAAAFDDEEILHMMTDTAERIVESHPEILEKRDPRSDVAAYQVTRDAMRRLRQEVTAAGTISIDQLESVSSRVKSRLAWLEKSGSLHVTGTVVVLGPAPAVEVAARVGNVPPFNGYYSSRTDLRTDEQKVFYAQFKLAALGGEPLDLEGNLSYAFVLLKELYSQRYRSPKRFERVLRLLADSHPYDSLGWYSRRWLADLRFLIGDFADGYRILSEDGRVDLEAYVNLSAIAGDTQITVAMVDSWLGKGNSLSSWALAKSTEVRATMQDLLDAAHADLGTSVVLDLWLRLFATRKVGDPVPDIEEEFGGFFSQEMLLNHIAAWESGRGTGYPRPRGAFFGMQTMKTVDWPSDWQTTMWFAGAAQGRLKAMYRQAENIARNKEGIRAVGEGWVAEVALLNELRGKFSDRRIVHQARPTWLRPQSLDIYFPDVNVAVEYQGVQHTKPVERFGGMPALQEQQERDRRKRAACSAHQCVLIEVHPGYDFESVAHEVQSAISMQLASAME